MGRLIRVLAIVLYGFAQVGFVGLGFVLVQMHIPGIDPGAPWIIKKIVSAQGAPENLASWFYSGYTTSEVLIIASSSLLLVSWLVFFFGGFEDTVSLIVFRTIATFTLGVMFGLSFLGFVTVANRHWSGWWNWAVLVIVIVVWLLVDSIIDAAQDAAAEA
jgi:hypothetical protein